MMNTPIKAAALALAALLSPISQADETRIISAGSTVTELLFELGADKDVVAIDLTSRHYLGDRDIPVLGYHRQLAAEGLLALSPTHLLGSPDMGPDTTLKLLKSAGVEVKALPVGNTLEDFKQRVDAVAKITHTEAKGEEIKQNVTNQINALSAAQPADKPSVMFMMLSDGRPLTVAGAETTVNTVIELAGGVNPAAKETSSYKPLSTESIVEMQPEYILISERTLEQIGGIDAVIEQQPLLAATPAVQNGNIITISGYSILGGFGLASLDLATELNERFNAK
ncbi:heme/hemin ABC transporter substrate-binding protein [Enterovibrio nigricans]|uniref:Iron complex transport system substrate-binding protein n=1 Tax=Enterovibrio nigricans DSM 22720 TaxID=1121868 RepID=A0A1T4V5E0_9GAMM|nr:ABC transporter substrate-binding protein [Enterovibrio nigricans]PKF50397.1 hemin ABC transporter substrate-binding protein [Enterovibrio nigricans]SKA60104.1 iron complex transport system substrate-binding protein [Enterovibrio nigricans DSM 22720]